jgi:hypothetical protein
MPIHFNPDNILKRLNFRVVGAEQAAKETTDANTPVESETAT